MPRPSRERGASKATNRAKTYHEPLSPNICGTEADMLCTLGATGEDTFDCDELFLARAGRWPYYQRPFSPQLLERGEPDLWAF